MSILLERFLFQLSTRICFNNMISKDQLPLRKQSKLCKVNMGSDRNDPIILVFYKTFPLNKTLKYDIINNLL